ncbi:hypothetical protein TRICI_005114 [Trichomonascus ciferrii]|uniref:Coatomer subunit delta n=1 Tax=Trichomonascus ciferrii TaxID=44093 RepID=A0A642UW06_9ASCO|nr:hypothetical protein TRICI_005114 [Trichomonascus ciferrii]
MFPISAGGKAVLSRQFRELHKDRVAALLANFPKLTQSGTQHTTVEDENVRYVYQPLDELYVVLITNRQSNILQDIETLRLLAQVVSSIARTVDEREVLNSAFEILSAFDEVVTLGYRENLTLTQIKTFLEMESHEEKIQQIIERNKELEAAEERKKKAKQLEMARKEVSRRGPNTSPFAAPPPPPSIPQHQPAVPEYEEPVRPSVNRGAPRGKGLQLGKKKAAGGNLESALESSPLMSSSSTPQPLSQPVAQPQPQPQSTNEGIEISLVEQLNVRLGRDGSVKSSEVKGNLQLRIGDPNLTKIKVLTSADGSPGQYKTHPNVDKGGFQSSKAIGLKDPSRGFPSNNQQLGVLRWKLSGRGDDQTYVPITFNCWFSRSDPGFFDVTLEYEVNGSFGEPIKNLKVYIPLVTANCHVADPAQVWDQYDDHLEWVIPEIQPNSDNASGAFEFTAEADSEDDFFPMDVSFSIEDSLSSFGQVDVLDVVSAANDTESLPFEKKISLVTENYVIE